MMPTLTPTGVLERFRQLQSLEEALASTSAEIKRQAAHLKELRQEYAGTVELMRKTVRDQAALPFDGQS